MLNIEKYKEMIIDRYTNRHGTLVQVVEQIVQEEEPEVYRKLCNEKIFTTEKMIDWLASEYVEPVLNKKEMMYLTGVMNPFIKHVEYVIKKEIYQDYEYICIMLKGVEAPFNLPAFRKGKMYVGMKLGKQYSVDDLGICEKS